MALDGEQRDPLTAAIIGGAIEVHEALGPGLLESVHEAQLLTYMKLSAKRVGLLLNFHTPFLRDSIVRMVL